MAPVVLDVQAMQSEGYRERGIARYTLQFADALLKSHPGYVDRLVLNPDLPPPSGVDALVPSGKLATGSQSWNGGDAAIYHALSPFELDVPFPSIWPPAVSSRRMRLVVTVHDLIPEIYPDVYLLDHGLRRRYRARLELIRAADHVMTISRSCARDVVEHLGVDEDKVSVVGSAAASRFVPPASRATALARARDAVPGLEERYCVYNGAVEPRKNMECLLTAYGRLPDHVRARWQLVIVCALNDLQRHHYEVRAAELGFADRLLLTGFAIDDTLVALYQATDLVVFPSLYEGFGLPVAEGLACGAAVIAADNSSLVELVDAEARFDATRPEAIAEAIEQALTDPARRAALLDRAKRPLPGWADVADRAVEVYDRLLAGPRPRWRGRPRLAVVSPWPPATSGVARYSVRLVEAMQATGRAEIDVFVDHPDGVNTEAELPGADALRRVDLVEGGYDRVLYCLGNSEFHAGALRLLRVGRRPGVVLAHDVRLTGLYRHAEPRGAVPEGFWTVLHAMYPALADEVGREGWLPPEVADRLGILMVREIIGRATAFVTTSEYAAALARAEALPGDVGKVRAVPFAFPAPARGAHAPQPGLMASFGVVNEVKRTALVVEAFAVVAAGRADARLAVVGPASDEEALRLRALAASLGVADRVAITGAVGEDEYRAWLGAAAVAVQLRASTNGESSAAVADCLAAGVPTLVSAVGPALELPDGAVIRVAPDIGGADLATIVGALLDDGAAQQALSGAGRAHAATHGFDRAASALLDELVGPPRR